MPNKTRTPSPLEQDRVAIHADIVDGRYYVGEHDAGSLPGLCVKLIAAGFDPEKSVECRRPGRSEWDIRAKSIKAVAALRGGDEHPGRGSDSPRTKDRTQGASLARSWPSEKSSRIYTRDDLIWDGHTLKLRADGRALAVIKRDPDFPALYRVHCGDRVSDLVNATRARASAIALALMALNHVSADTDSSKQTNGPESPPTEADHEAPPGRKRGRA